MGQEGAAPKEEYDWHKVAERDELADGRVKSATAGRITVALSKFEGKHWAVDNRCPHQGGPLGEGSIETGAEGRCWIRCPWHGWDFDPRDGTSPGGHDDGIDTFPVEERDDGIYVGVPKPGPHKTTVTDIMAQTMTRWGVTHVFGMVGHSNLGLADALRLEEDAGHLTYIGIRHEGAASFACSGFAKLSGKPAACLAIAGPGATNMLTGLWDAKMDRAPVLALTGQVNTQVLGPGAFQEVDLAAAFSAVSTWSQTVLPGSDHAELMTLALKHATVKRDVTHLIFPDEVQTLPAKETARPSSPKGRLGDTHITPAPESLDQAMRFLNDAKRPIIVVGYGARTAMDKIIRLAEKLNAPVLTTFKGKGQIPDAHPLAGGVLGRSGTPIASWFMNESDVICVFGASFSDHTGISTSKVLIQVDFEQMALGKFHMVHAPVWGEVGVTADLMHERVAASAQRVDQRTEIAERWRIWREEKSSRLADDRGRGIPAAAIFDTLTRVIPEDAVIAVDVGNNTYSFGRYFEPKNQAVLMSGYLGSIGFGFPAAMGAWAAVKAGLAPGGPNRKVVSISGDGGFGQYMGEFTTAVKYGMNITHVLLNNGELGKISKEQRAGQWPVWQTGLHNPSFADYAKLCGGVGIRVERREDLERALTEGLQAEGPALVEIMQDVELV